MTRPQKEAVLGARAALLQRMQAIVSERRGIVAALQVSEPGRMVSTM